MSPTIGWIKSIDGFLESSPCISFIQQWRLRTEQDPRGSQQCILDFLFFFIFWFFKIYEKFRRFTRKKKKKKNIRLTWPHTNIFFNDHSQQYFLQNPKHGKCFGTMEKYNDWLLFLEPPKNVWDCVGYMEVTWMRE